MCREYHIQVNMYDVSAQGVDECMINVHYYYYLFILNVRTAVDACDCTWGLHGQRKTVGTRS